MVPEKVFDETVPLPEDVVLPHPESPIIAVDSAPNVAMAAKRCMFTPARPFVWGNIF
jgi:hypothetical protein